MKAILVLLLVSLATAARAAEWAPSQALLDAVRRVESADGLYTVGDNGRSLGNYQISEAAWVDVNAWRKSRGLPTFKYEKKVWSEKVSRGYAADYLKILHRRLKQRLNREPTSLELYAAYNRGFSSFARCGYRSSCLTPVQREILQSSQPNSGLLLAVSDSARF